MSIQPFRVAIPQAKIERLHQKLAATDFPDELSDVGWSHGAPLADIKRLAHYWQHDFDWRGAEAELNAMPQFSAPVAIEGHDPLSIHFVHARSPVAGAIPLLFVHGWPGSFDEVVKLLPLLTDNSAGGGPSFHVVAPSLPDYGFSSRNAKGGFGKKQMAQVCHKLMTEVLGYGEYVTQGGDVGYGVTRWMGYLFPESVKASHYNFAQPSEPTKEKFPELYELDQKTPRTEAEKRAEERTNWFDKEGRGYYWEHATKPQTLGYSLTDSPVGLLAWIYEKLHDWTDDYPWTDYEVCKWVSIYWFSTPGPLASLRVYYDSRHAKDPFAPYIDSVYLKDVKIGCSKFPKELINRPALWNGTLGELVFNKEHESGGHFAAFERPNELAGDLKEMFGKNGGAYGVVSGSTGY